METEAIVGIGIVVVIVSVMFLFMLPKINEMQERYTLLADEYNKLVNSYREYMFNQTERYNQLLKDYKENIVYYSDNRGVLDNLNNLTKEDFGPMGIYYARSFYCVWVEGRDLEKISITESHEMCHHFVEMDKPHFCERKNQTNWELK